MLYFTGEALEDDESVSVPLRHALQYTNTKKAPTQKPRDVCRLEKQFWRTSFVSSTVVLRCVTVWSVFTVHFVLFLMQFEEEELEEGDEEVG